MATLGWGSNQPTWRSRAIAIALILIVIALVCVFIARSPDHYQPWLATGVLGALVAVAELVTRYRDDPPSAVFSLPGEIYVMVNVAASVAALYLIHAFDWRFGATANTLQVTQVMVAGFGSAALFRSSLLNVTVGNQQVGIGPSIVLNVILSAADRAVDRQRAWVRVHHAASIMKGLPFDLGADAMLAFTGQAMQNLTDAELQSLESRVSVLRDKKSDGVPDEVKSYVLGLALMSLTGRRTLQVIAEEVEAVLSTAKTRRDAAAGSASAPASADQQVLDYLRNNGGSAPITSLRRDLALSYRDASAVLSRLTSVGAASISGDGDAETVTLES